MLAGEVHVETAWVQLQNPKCNIERVAGSGLLAADDFLPRSGTHDFRLIVSRE